MVVTSFYGFGRVVTVVTHNHPKLSTTVQHPVSFQGVGCPGGFGRVLAVLAVVTLSLIHI